jgi:predicted permease
MSGRFAIGAVLCYALLIATGILMSKLLMLEGKTANIFIALTAFGNMGFMGIPLIRGIFQEPTAQVCISIFTIIDMTLIWTLGVYLCSRHRESSNSLSAIKNMVNPTTCTLSIAFVVMLFQVRLPDLFMSTIPGIGNTSKFLTMIYVGGVLAYVSMGNIAKNPSIFVLSIVKMLMIPVIRA